MTVAITQYNKKNRESIEKRISQDLNAGREGEWKKLKTTHKLQQKKKKATTKVKMQMVIKQMIHQPARKIES
jgi:hypothetical protein